MNNILEQIENHINQVTVLHGAHERRFLPAGQTVAAVQAALTTPLNIPSQVIAVVNGQSVEPSYVLKAQDTLEFIRATGERGRASDGEMLLKLKNFCTALPPGPVADVRTLEPLLAAVWHTLPSDDASLEGYKLLGRMEAVAWDARC